MSATDTTAQPQVITTRTVRFAELEPDDDVVVAVDAVVLPEFLTITQPSTPARAAVLVAYRSQTRLLEPSAGARFAVRRPFTDPPDPLPYCGCHGPHHGGTRWCAQCFDRDWKGLDDDARLTYRGNTGVTDRAVDVLRLAPGLGLEGIASGYDNGQTLGGHARRGLVKAVDPTSDPLTGHSRRTFQITTVGRAFLRGRDLAESSRRSTPR